MAIKCKMCGSDLYPEEGQDIVVCEVCGSEQTVPHQDEQNDDHKIDLFEEANAKRLGNFFDEAIEIYNHIIDEYPDELEAYWCLLLCKYGIEYTDDPKKEKKIPTCHRANKNSILNDPVFEFIMQKSSPEQAEVWNKEAQSIDKIQRDILNVSKTVEPYDIFICFKKTDFEGKKTQDTLYATMIYSDLTDRGYRVFFSEISLKQCIGNYEPYIFSALNSAKLMLVLGTKPEFMEAPWVRNEWSRFLELKSENMGLGIIPCIGFENAYEMPDELTAYQAKDLRAWDFEKGETYKTIDKFFGREQATQVQVQAPKEDKTDKKKTISKINMKIFNGDYDEANDLIEEILENDFDDIDAWALKVGADLKGSKAYNEKAAKSLKRLLSLCGPEDKKKYEEKYDFLLNKTEQVVVPVIQQEPQPYRQSPSQPFNNSSRQQPREHSYDPRDSYRDLNSFARQDRQNHPRQSLDNIFGGTQRSSNENADSLYEKGEKLYSNKEYFKAFEYFQKAGALSHKLALIRMGDCYMYGYGVSKDPTRAVEYYKSVANTGNGEALNKLGDCYNKGIGVNQSDVEAFNCYKKAAETGHMFAQANLSNCYKLGKGCRKDIQSAFTWLKKSADQGDAQSQNSLGYCYEKGFMTEQNLDEASRLYELAARQGVVQAQNNLGMMYYYGKVGNNGQDCQKAAYWYEQAAKNGHAESQYNLASLYKTGRLNGKKDLKKYFTWLRKSALLGYSVAQYKLGLAYQNGDGTDVDKDSAYYWMYQAAKQNHPDAKRTLEMSHGGMLR